MPIKKQNTDPKHHLEKRKMILHNVFDINAVFAFFFQERCWFETVFPEEFTRFSEGKYSPSQSYTAVKKKVSEI